MKTLLLVTIFVCLLPLPVFAQVGTEVESWMWDTETSTWVLLSSPSNPDPCAVARAFASLPDSASCTDEYQHLEWSIPSTRWEWWVSEPGFYACNARVFHTKLQRFYNSCYMELCYAYFGFEDLIFESTCVDSIIPIRYAIGDFATPPVLGDPEWVSADTINWESEWDSIGYPPEDVYMKWWNMVEVKEPNCDGEYGDDAIVELRYLCSPPDPDACLRDTCAVSAIVHYYITADLKVYDPGCGDKLILSWEPSSASNLEGYSVYRSETSGGPYNELNDALVIDTVYLDDGIQLNSNYYYYIGAVTSSGEFCYTEEDSGTARYPGWF